MRFSDWSSDVCTSDLFPTAAFTGVRGVAASILRRAESGREIHGFFCAACGTRLYDRFPVFSEIMVLKAGTLDDTSGLEPVAQFWTSRKQDWVALPADQLLRSEEHTSELQSLMRISYAVFCLKQKKTQIKTP